MPTAYETVEKTLKLPPLILHPFSDSAGPNKLVESSRASLMLQGLLPTGDFSQDDLERRLVDGRYCEIRMLFYVGKDVNRWIEQCLEMAQRDGGLCEKGYQFQSFADILVNRPPRQVREKLKKWGVADYKSIFSRAIGLHSVFAEVPERNALSPQFIKHYYRYADHMFLCRQNASAFPEVHADQFDFDLYASAEYTRLLEQEWESE
jgi:hypothetical protein